MARLQITLPNARAGPTLEAVIQARFASSRSSSALRSSELGLHQLRAVDVAKEHLQVELQEPRGLEFQPLPRANPRSGERCKHAAVRHAHSKGAQHHLELLVAHPYHGA